MRALINYVFLIILLIILLLSFYVALVCFADTTKANLIVTIVGSVLVPIVGGILRLVPAQARECFENSEPVRWGLVIGIVVAGILLIGLLLYDPSPPPPPPSTPALSSPITTMPSPTSSFTPSYTPTPTALLIPLSLVCNGGGFENVDAQFNVGPCNREESPENSIEFRWKVYKAGSSGGCITTLPPEIAAEISAHKALVMLLEGDTPIEVKLKDAAGTEVSIKVRRAGKVSIPLADFSEQNNKFDLNNVTALIIAASYEEGAANEGSVCLGEIGFGS